MIHAILVFAVLYPVHCAMLCPETLTTRTPVSPVVCEPNKIAGRCGAPRPPMTDVGTETAFRLDQRKHFRKSKHLLRSEVN